MVLCGAYLDPPIYLLLDPKYPLFVTIYPWVQGVGCLCNQASPEHPSTSVKTPTESSCWSGTAKHKEGIVGRLPRACRRALTSLWLFSAAVPYFMYVSQVWFEVIDVSHYLLFGRSFSGFMYYFVLSGRKR